MKSHASTTDDRDKHKVTDEELQTTMMIWHESDDDGTGVDAAGLGAVVSKMFQQGLIQMTIGTECGGVLMEMDESEEFDTTCCPRGQCPEPPWTFTCTQDCSDFVLPI